MQFQVEMKYQSESGRSWEIYEAVLEIKYSCFGVEILVRAFGI